VKRRLELVRQARLASDAESTRRFADYPMLFRQIAQPSTDYLAIPEVSSERRRYIPIAFVDKSVICSNKIQFIGEATHFHFGVLTSAMHMAWMRYTCGRLESRYSYSNTIVYNNFPWPSTLQEKLSTSIEAAAQGVLDTRALFEAATLAELYDPLTMPPALVKAHETLDRAVDAAYMPDGGKRAWASDADRVTFLFTRYQQITSLLPSEPSADRRSRSANSSTRSRKTGTRAS